MTATKRQIEKPRPNSRKTRLPKSARVLPFRKKKGHVIPRDNRFDGFSEGVRDWLNDNYSQ